jgi:hypothetical protein
LRVLRRTPGICVGFSVDPDVGSHGSPSRQAESRYRHNSRQLSLTQFPIGKTSHDPSSCVSLCGEDGRVADFIPQIFSWAAINGLQSESTSPT